MSNTKLATPLTLPSGLVLPNRLVKVRTHLETTLEKLGYQC